VFEIEANLRNSLGRLGGFLLMPTNTVTQMHSCERPHQYGSDKGIVMHWKKPSFLSTYKRGASKKGENVFTGKL
jgi:hypothetical protein